VSARRITRAPLLVHESATVEAAPSTRRDVIVAGKPFDLSGLQGLAPWSEIANELQAKADGFTDSVAYLHAIMPFLKCCAGHGSINQAAVHAYRSEVEDLDEIHANTKSERFGYALNFVKRLQHNHIVAHFDLPNNIGREPQKPKPTLFEVAPLTWQSASTRVRDEAERLMASKKVNREIALAAATIRVRTSALRLHAEAEIEAIHQTYRETKVILDIAKETGVTSRLAELSCLPSSASLEEAIAWSWARYGVILPRSSADHSLYHHVKTRFGGFSGFQKRFCPTADALSPFLVLYLCEENLAANVDGITRYTTRDCLGPGDSPSSKVITFGKERPSQKEISRELACGQKSEWTLPRALTFLIEYTGQLLGSGLRLDPRIKIQDKTKLFLHFDKQRHKWVTHLDKGTVADTLRRFVRRAAARHPDLIPLIGVVTGENFRPSHAFVHRVDGKTIFGVQRVLEHGSANTTRQYSERQLLEATVPQRELAFQTCLVKEMHGHAERSSYSVAKENSSDREDAYNGPESKKGTLCKAREECDSSGVRAVLVIEDVSTTAEWIRWEAHIETHQAWLEAHYPERWGVVWAPKLARYKACLEKTTARTKAKAAKLVLAVAKPMPPLT
jgi:hypothetical protein